MEVDTEPALHIGNLKPKSDRPVVALGIEGSANKVRVLPDQGTKIQLCLRFKSPCELLLPPLHLVPCDTFWICADQRRYPDSSK